MPSLKTMQTYAEKCAQRLNLSDMPVLRWLALPCVTRRRENAHCHTSDEVKPRGTICIKRGNPRLQTIKRWHYLIAHEVSHLATKCTHSSYTFAKRMETLGQASFYEVSYLKTRRRHRHVYSQFDFGTGFFYCQFCGKKEE